MGANILTRTKVINFTKKGNLWSVITENKKGEIQYVDPRAENPIPKMAYIQAVPQKTIQ